MKKVILAAALIAATGQAFASYANEQEVRFGRDVQAFAGIKVITNNGELGFGNEHWSDINPAMVDVFSNERGEEDIVITTTSVSSNLEQYRDTVTYNVMGEDAKSGDTITVAASNDRHTQDGTFAVYAKVGATQDMIKAGHAEVITTIKLAAPRI